MQQTAYASQDTLASLAQSVAFLSQSRLVTHVLGGLLPGFTASDMAAVSTMLHIGCGPGPWTIALAQAYPLLVITGLDSEEAMISTANREAGERGLYRLHHQKAESLTGPFAFPAGSFDAISMQCLSHRLSSWTRLLKECVRLLRPGGRIHITDYGVGQSNAPAHTELMSLLSLTGRQNVGHAGSLQELEGLLGEQGFHTSSRIQTVEYSYGAAVHEEWKRQVLIASTLAQPWLIKHSALTPQRLETLLRQQQVELQLPSFQGVQPIITLWGVKG